jgi:hypothetical protein
MAEQLKRTRRALKLWRRKHANVYQQESDCKIVINLLDHVEEHRALSAPEISLRTIITAVLSRTANAKLAIWRQRSKVRAAIEGDENTRYFQVCANQRRRKNQIQIIESNGLELHTQEHKAAVLHDFYLNLLGTKVTTSWNFSLNDLYPEDAPPLQHLADSFTLDEINLAVRRMHSTASPGPDGFGLYFFKSCWATVSLSLSNLFSTFHDHRTDLARIIALTWSSFPKKKMLGVLKISGPSHCKTPPLNASLRC